MQYTIINHGVAFREFEPIIVAILFGDRSESYEETYPTAYQVVESRDKAIIDDMVEQTVKRFREQRPDAEIREIRVGIPVA